MPAVVTTSASAPTPASRPVPAFGLALAVFAAAVVATKLVPRSITGSHPWVAQGCQQGLMVLVAVGAMIASGRPLAAFGFRRAKIEWPLALAGVLFGAVATDITLLLGLPGMRTVASRYNFPTLVLWVWIVSSVAEEIFCRGWFQSLAAGWDSDPRAARVATVWSAALFGSLHLVLLIAGIDLASFAIILVSVTALGYVCAVARARSGSLVPAIAAHVGFNIGGFLGGLAYAIAYRITTGHLPFAR